jgi:hypothetical protein
VITVRLPEAIKGVTRVIPHNDHRYKVTAFSKKFELPQPDWITFSPKDNYQTIHPGASMRFPLWLVANLKPKGKLKIIFSCETRNGESETEFEVHVV